MFQQSIAWLKALPLSDKYLLGVSAGILINHQLALLSAIVIVGVFGWRLYKELAPKESKA